MDQYPFEVHSDGMIKNRLNFYLGNGMAPEVILWKIRGDVSASKYQKIVRAVEKANQQRGRNDAIINPREPPYNPLPSIRIKTIRELQRVVRARGTAFNCLVDLPEDDWDGYRSIVFKAGELGVEVDTWTK